MVDELAEKTLRVCNKMGWKRSWSEGGCYLHLEASEFIEALRGKGDSPAKEEAADVLFVLFSMLVKAGFKPSEVLQILDQKCDEILAPTFIEMCLAGQVPDIEKGILDFVDAWHEDKEGRWKLHLRLGMSWDEYTQWVQDGSCLKDIIESRRAGTPQQ